MAVFLLATEELIWGFIGLDSVQFGKLKTMRFVIAFLPLVGLRYFD